MSEELIRRSDAIKALHGEAQITGKENAMAVQHLIGRFTFNIANIPSVDIIEPKRGEWIRTFDGNEWYWYCSNCKNEWYEDDLYMGGNEFPNFCPNCGASMREREGE